MDATAEQARPLSITVWNHSPVRQRVVDHLADLMFHAHDILAMLSCESTPEGLRRIEPTIRQVYENVNDLMKSLCD